MSSDDEEPNSVPELPKSPGDSGSFSAQSVPSRSGMGRQDFATRMTVGRPAIILKNYDGTLPLCFGANRNPRPVLPIHGATTRTDVKVLVHDAPFRKMKKNTSVKEDCAFQISHLHPNFLDHIALVSNDGFITAILSMSTKKPLVKALSGNSLPSKERSLIWTDQVCRAMYYLHTKHLIHGCLDPYLVHIDSSSQVKLFLAPFPLFTPDRNSPYTATELRECPVAAPTLESDIYSLGCLIFFILEGRVPEKDMFDVVMREDLSVGMVETLRPCWNNPDDRPSAVHLIEAVTNEH